MKVTPKSPTEESIRLNTADVAENIPDLESPPKLSSSGDLIQMMLIPETPIVHSEGLDVAENIPELYSPDRLNSAVQLEVPVLLANPIPTIPKVQTRLGTLNGLRGFACLSILFYHSFLNGLVQVDVAPKFEVPFYPFYIWPLTWLSNAISGVDLFFVLSGFVLYLPYCPESRSFDLSSFWNFIKSCETFYKSRCERLLPLYFFSLAVFVLFWVNDPYLIKTLFIRSQSRVLKNSTSSRVLCLKRSLSTLQWSLFSFRATSFRRLVKLIGLLPMSSGSVFFSLSTPLLSGSFIASLSFEVLSYSRTFS